MSSDIKNIGFCAFVGAPAGPGPRRAAGRAQGLYSDSTGLLQGPGEGPTGPRAFGSRNMSDDEEDYEDEDEQVEEDDGRCTLFL